MSKFEELTEVLDDGVAMLKRRADLLDQIADYVQNRDVEELEEVVTNSPAFEDMENELMRRIRLQCQLVAEERGVELERYTLSRLIKTLQNREALILQDLRERLILVIDEVQKKAQYVARMASRVRQVEERMLMAALGQEDQTTTYGSDGHVARGQQGMALQQNA